MRRTIPVLIAFFILLAACRKDKLQAGASILQGEWKLISIKDKSPVAEFFKPAGETGDVLLKFSGNKFSGQTLRNTISGGSYTLQNGTEITFGSYSMTQVMEDQWGGMFLTILNACGLQSIHPCLPSTVTVQGNTMTIVSALRYDLKLERN